MMQKSEWVKIRIAVDEKLAFQNSADLAGISLSGWMRERLRRAARIELTDAGQQVPFVRTKAEEG
jgi:hypothetical protein